jgi:hypothetical protein
MATNSAISIARARMGRELDRMKDQEEGLRRTAVAPLADWGSANHSRRMKDLLDGADQLHEAAEKLSLLDGDALAARFAPECT